MSRTDKKPNRSGIARPARGTLMFLAILLVSSAAVRLTDDAGRAYAVTQEAMQKPTAPDSEPGDVPVEQTSTCEPAPDIAQTLELFQKREARVKLREAQIADRIQALSVADREIDRKLASLTEAEEKLRATLALADSAAEDDLTRLTSVYESMKPKEAAALFEQMDPEFAAGFLGRMQPAAAAGVMAGLQPETAYAFSVILAGRNTNVPKN